jgi:hypothetical protein
LVNSKDDQQIREDFSSDGEADIDFHIYKDSARRPGVAGSDGPGAISERGELQL